MVAAERKLYIWWYGKTTYHMSAWTEFCFCVHGGFTRKFF